MSDASLPWAGSPLSAPQLHGRLDGPGTYTFANGDRFDGPGKIYLKNGGVFTAEWQAGIAINGEYTFPDGLTHADNDWTYCTPEDRRFHSERQSEGKTSKPDMVQLTNHAKTPRIPVGTFDVGDGYLESDTGLVRDYFSHAEKRHADAEEVVWAQEKCRRGVLET